MKPINQSKPLAGSACNLAHPMMQGIALCVPMLEGQGQLCTDYASGFDMVSVGGVWVPGLHGPALKYPGSSPNYMTSRGSNNLPLMNVVMANAKMSAAVWVRPDVTGSNFNPFIACYTSGVGAWQLGYGGSSKFGFVVNGLRQAQTTFTFTTGQWYHLAATWDGATITFYINGVFESSTSYSASNFGAGAQTATSIAGESRDPIYSQVTIESAFAWGRVLSPAEISRLYADPYGMFVRRVNWWESTSVPAPKPDWLARKITADPERFDQLKPRSFWTPSTPNQVQPDFLPWRPHRIPADPEAFDQVLLSKWKPATPNVFQPIPWLPHVREAQPEFWDQVRRGMYGKHLESTTSLAPAAAVILAAPGIPPAFGSTVYPAGSAVPPMLQLPAAPDPQVPTISLTIT